MKTRKHISKGYLVYSTNPVQRQLAKALTIQCTYERLNRRRISRVVLIT